MLMLWVLLAIKCCDSCLCAVESLCIVGVPYIYHTFFIILKAGTAGGFITYFELTADDGPRFWKTTTRPDGTSHQLTSR